MLDPARTLAILAGASAWPNFPAFTPARAFSNTATGAFEYLSAETGVKLDTAHILNLFDDGDVMSQYARIEAFLREGLGVMDAPHGEGAIVLFWYIGHGAFLGRTRDYCLLVRGSSELFAAETSMRVSALAHALQTVAPRSSRVIILDCCFAAEAARHFQGTLDQAVAAQVSGALAADRGVVVLAASGARRPALLEDETTRTSFGAALLDVLEAGDPQRGEGLTVRDLGELSWQRLATGGLDAPPRPEVHSPDQAYGDLSTVPLFPNHAASKQSTRGPMENESPLAAAESGPPAFSHPKPRSDGVQIVLVGRPVVAIKAAQHLAKLGGALTEQVVDGLPDSEWRRRALRLAVQGDAVRANDVLVPAIMDSDRNWRRGSKAASLLTPSLRPTVAASLGAAMSDLPGVEASRMIIEGLGRLGACGYASSVVGAAEASAYEWDKLGGYAAIALARMIRFCDSPDAQSTEQISSTMRVQASFLERHQSAPELNSVMWDVRREMQLLRARHADGLIREYLRSTTPLLVGLGATALGHMRLVRARAHLADRYSSGSDLGSATRRTLLLEIARIGGPGAVDFLASTDDPVARVALSRCLESASDGQFQGFVEQALADEGVAGFEGWWVYRAIGRRPLDSLVAFLEDGLTSDEASDRGVSALALAKATGPAARPRLEVARSEASTRQEELLTSLSLLVATGDTAIVEQVEEGLAEEGWRYEPILFEDVLNTLDGWGGSPGQDLAEALRWIHSAP